MDIPVLIIFLSSGLFLGWSLGANDAANVFGTAVGSKMISFRRAAIIASIGVVLGAFAGGSGGAHTLGALGAVNAIGGAFTVALSAGFAVYIMTKFQLPVSTSQAIVGAIIGWNLYAGKSTDLGVLSKISATWVISPILAALFAFVLYKLLRLLLLKLKLHLFHQDVFIRWALILSGAFGAYSLGANNIANVMGVFVPVVPFDGVSIGQIGASFNWEISAEQILFLIGGIAIAVGIFTYSKRVMMTVGNDIYKLSPESAFVVVLASSLVLFIFASQDLNNLLLSVGLPTIPLVPVSSSQAVVGAVMGVAITRGGKNINFSVIGRISIGWITTPLSAGLLSFVSLFLVENIFRIVAVY